MDREHRNPAPPVPCGTGVSGSSPWGLQALSHPLLSPLCFAQIRGQLCWPSVSFKLQGDRNPQDKSTCDHRQSLPGSRGDSSDTNYCSCVPSPTRKPLEVAFPIAPQSERGAVEATVRMPKHRNFIDAADILGDGGSPQLCNHHRNLGFLELHFWFRGAPAPFRGEERFAGCWFLGGL